PALSVTVQVTVVLPSGKVSGALLLTEATPQLSAVSGVPRAKPVASHPESALTVTASGAVIVGTVVSFTVTVWVAVAVKPALSVTVQVTVVLPSGKVSGESLLTEAMPQLSAVSGVPRATPVASHPESALTVTASGAVIVGDRKSV